MRHAGGDGSHARVASGLAARTVVAPDRQRLTGSLSEPGTARVHPQVVAHAGAAVAGTAAPAVVGPMVVTWKEASHTSQRTRVFDNISSSTTGVKLDVALEQICFVTCPHFSHRQCQTGSSLLPPERKQGLGDSRCQWRHFNLRLILSE